MTFDLLLLILLSVVVIVVAFLGLYIICKLVRQVIFDIHEADDWYCVWRDRYNKQIEKFKKEYHITEDSEYVE